MSALQVTPCGIAFAAQFCKRRSVQPRGVPAALYHIAMFAIILEGSWGTRVLSGRTRPPSGIAVAKHTTSPFVLCTQIHTTRHSLPSYLHQVCTRYLGLLAPSSYMLLRTCSCANLHGLLMQMASLDDIVSVYRTKGNTYAFDGSCVLAGSDAEQWLSSMGVEVKYVTGLLVSEQKMKMVSGTEPGFTQRKCTTVYKLVQGCMWMFSHNIPAIDVSGHVHHVVPNKDFFIDWSLAQFLPWAPGAEPKLYM